MLRRDHVMHRSEDRASSFAIPAHIVTLFEYRRKSGLMAALTNRLNRHVAALRTCHRCPNMVSGPVSGGAVISRVILVGQAPGVKKPYWARRSGGREGKP